MCVCIGCLHFLENFEIELCKLKRDRKTLIISQSCDIFKCIVLSDQKLKTQRYSVYCRIKQRKAGKKSHLRSWNKVMFWIFALNFKCTFFIHADRSTPML